MERLVYLDRAHDVGPFLQKAAWRGVDGVEIDLTSLSEDEYTALSQHLADSGVPVGSVHYERTQTISLQEWALFASQLDHVVDRAKELGADLVSVHPPKAEIGTTNTVRDLQEFMAAADTYAREAEIQICFVLDGFLKDPELINTGFAHLNNPAIGIMVDVSRLVNGIDPLHLLEQLGTSIHKIRAPVTVSELEQELAFTRDITAVAEQIE